MTARNMKEAAKKQLHQMPRGPGGSTAILARWVRYWQQVKENQAKAS